MKRLVAYIDGFNLYHAVDALGEPRLKWLDLWALAEGLCRSDEVVFEVNYFSAYATWLPSSYAKHRVYVAALKARGVNVILGQFKKKPRECRACGAKWDAHEEKETDVHVAIRLVADTIVGRYDRAILISADSDLSPALKMAKLHAKTGVEILPVAPPGRLSAARGLSPRLELTKGRLRAAMLPDDVFDGKGNLVAQRPSQWR